MTRKTFLLLLLLCIGIGSCINIVLGLNVERIGEHIVLSWIALSLYSVSCLPLYFIGIRMAEDENKLKFNQLIFSNIAFKMFITLAIVVAYHKIVEPSDSILLLPFFGIYILFTIFETYFLSRIAKVKTNGRPLV